MGILLSLSANATAFYNLGAHWKGALNPYYLGAEGVFQGGFTSGLSASVPGNGDGSTYRPSRLVFDSTGNLYVVDSGLSRINKYDSSGIFQGWIGKIATSPTGGAAGCNGAAAGTFTPGWCKGGTSTSGSGDGMMSTPTAIAVDSSGNLYVSDTDNNRINKYDSSGIFQGWIGNIATSPTGGAAGCNGAAVGTFTPGWCKGGSSTYGWDDGMLWVPLGLAVDSSFNLYVVDSYNNRVVKYNSLGAFQGWIGLVADSPTGGVAGCIGAANSSTTPGWCTGGTSSIGGNDGQGGLSSPDDLALDLSGNIYVADVINRRVVKYSSSGAYQGWIGAVFGTPTGGAAGCTTATIVTPGWCKGGIARAGSGDGMFQSPSGFALDSSGNFYISDESNHRIAKYNLSGVFQGWIGKIATSPTGGAAGCSGAATGTFTPGWCTGGTSASGSGDGMMNLPKGLAIDASGNLYVADQANSRISKYSSTGAKSGALQSVAQYVSWHRPVKIPVSGHGDGMLQGPTDVKLDSSKNIYVVDSGNSRINKYNSSGVFQGWIGKIATSPTGGAAGCNGAAVGSFTPGWCKGGTSTSGSGDGMMNTPTAIALDSSGDIYVGDSGNFRINKYSPSGVFQGWIGKIATPPNGGASGCSSASAGAFTPGWCTGGTAASGADDGSLSAVGGIVIDTSGNIYISDSSLSRINKYDSLGAFQGWIGKIATSPAGGASGCSTAAVGTFTPGWCTGGTSTSGTGNGMMNSPAGLALDSAGNLYLADYGNHRINKYDSLGAFQGWIGKIATSPAGGASGCSTAPVGTFTPGWCLGGSSASGSGDGMFNNPKAIVFDPAGYFYISDLKNYRIHKYKSSGVFQGWIGKINVSPTGGGTGCNGVVGAFTPGWCKGGGGADLTVSINDGFSGPAGLAFDPSGTLYMVDNALSRINRISLQGR